MGGSVLLAGPCISSDVAVYDETLEGLIDASLKMSLVFNRSIHC